MNIIISPAKKMKEVDSFIATKEPIYLEESLYLRKLINNLNLIDKQKMWKCSDKLFKDSLRLSNSNLKMPALFAYDGIQYQYMEPSLLDNESLDYLNNHLFILSALYGILETTSLISPYRLEMKHKINDLSLYDYWGDKPYKVINNDLILNLASKEYSDLITPYTNNIINVSFLEKDKDRYIQKGVHVKMVRGRMVRFLAENKISNPCDIKKFNDLSFTYSYELSNEKEYVFIKEEL